MVEPHAPPSSPAPLATFHAWWIAALLLLSLTVNFVDRLVLGSVAPALQSTLHFSSTQYSYMVSAFTLGMTLGQIPAGAFIDRIGFRAANPLSAFRPKTPCAAIRVWRKWSAPFGI